MKFVFAQIGITLVLLQTTLQRCKQQNSNFPNSIETEKPVYQASTKYNKYRILDLCSFFPLVCTTPIVKFKLSARQLTGRNRDFIMVKIDPYPILYQANDTKKDEDTCFIKETQNPNWNDEFFVFYKSEDTHLIIEVWDNVEAGDDYILGRTVVYVRHMLCEGRQIESSLWNHDVKENRYADEFYTGMLVVRTIQVTNPPVYNCGS